MHKALALPATASRGRLLARRLRGGDRLLRAAWSRRACGVLLEANCPACGGLGRPEEALERALRLAAVAVARGETPALIELRSLELAGRFARGGRGAPGEVEWLIEAVRLRAAELVAFARAGAAARSRRTTAGRASALLAD